MALGIGGRRARGSGQWWYLKKSVTHAEKTRPIEAAFIPTSMQRTHACLRALSQKGMNAKTSSTPEPVAAHTRARCRSLSAGPCAPNAPGAVRRACVALSRTKEAEEADDAAAHRGDGGPEEGGEVEERAGQRPAAHTHDAAA